MTTPSPQGPPPTPEHPRHPCPHCIDPSSNPATLQIDYDTTGVATFAGDNTILQAAVCAQLTGKSSLDTIAAKQTLIQMGRQTAAGCSYGNTALQ